MSWEINHLLGMNTIAGEREEDSKVSDIHLFHDLSKVEVACGSKGTGLERRDEQLDRNILSAIMRTW